MKKILLACAALVLLAVPAFAASDQPNAAPVVPKIDPVLIGIATLAVYDTQCQAVDYRLRSAGEQVAALHRSDPDLRTAVGDAETNRKKYGDAWCQMMKPIIGKMAREIQ
jgi:hypothetical protein